MRVKKSIPILLSLSCIIIFLNSCQEVDNLLCAGNVFNMDEFEANLYDALDGQVMGFAFVVTENGQVKKEGAGGFMRNAADGEVDMTINSRMHVASISKTITTVATMAILDEKNVGINATVSKYLPRDWTQGQGIENLTFSDLLSHGSGFNNRGSQQGGATVFDSLRAIIATGATAPKNPRYANSHHAMMRVILPRLWDKFRPNSGVYDDGFTASVYQQAIQEFVFNKLEILTADCDGSDNNPTRAYTGSNDNANGVGGTSNFCNRVGGFGWYASARQLAKFMAFVFFTDDIIDNDMRNLLINDELGFWNSRNGDNGRYMIKLGAWNYNNGQSHLAAVVHYPNNVQLTILVNSPLTNGTGLAQLAEDTFDASFGCF